MTDAAERELLQVAGSFRARARRIVAAVVINGTLAALCLGAPYARGRLRAKESQARFGAFAACLLDGKVSRTPGLSMPPGTANRFAQRYMADEPDWPRRCMTTLDSVAPDEAIFLWPAVKQADEDVRATVRLTKRELDAMADERGDSDDVPVRPLLALQKVRAALTLQARAAGNDRELDGNAISLPRASDLPLPATLPLGTAESASLHMRIHDGGLEVLSLDRAGITWMRVAQGEVDRTRVRRTSLVRDGMLQQQTPYILWATPEERCAERVDRCVRRATGVASYALGARSLPEPIWLAGHPAGPLAQTIRIDGSRLWLLARASAGGAVEVREFELPQEADAKAPPVAPTRRYGSEESVTTGARLLPGSPPPLFLPGGKDAPAPPRLVHPDGAVLPLGPIGPHGPWATACQSPGQTWLAHGDAYSLRISRFSGSSAVDEVAHIETKLRTGAATLKRPAVRLLCGDGVTHVLHLTHDLVLRHMRCEADACGAPETIVPVAVSFDAVLTGEGTLVVAASGGRNQRRIVTAVVTAEGKLGPARAPTPCWQDGDGMCGAPSLVVDDERVLLASRASGNLQVLESRDAGMHWQQMSGLKVGTAMTEGAHPLEQHRVRKGIH